jgi:hypothetical protein
MIDLSPSVSIDGYSVSTVQAAIATLAVTVSPPIITPASATSPGIIQLAGDLGGTATSPRVISLQSKPVSTAVPSLNQVLTWNGTYWTPENPPNGFTAGGDLSGTSSAQHVVSITGSSNNVSLLASNFTFAANLSLPYIYQASSSTAAGSNFLIAAQSTSYASANGGNLVLVGGDPGSGGLSGGVICQIGNSISPSYPIQALKIASGQRVVSLAHTAVVSTTDLPAGCGDMVVYVHNAVISPTSNPTNGVILYGNGGQLWLMQGDAAGLNFQVGTDPNPKISGANGQQTYLSRGYATTLSTATAVLITYAIGDNTANNVEATIVGRSTNSTDSIQYKFSTGYVRHSGGAPTAVGITTSSDSRCTAGASFWTLPSISISGNNLLVNTGASNTTQTITWFATLALVTVT